MIYGDVGVPESVDDSVLVGICYVDGEELAEEPRKFDSLKSYLESVG